MSSNKKLTYEQLVELGYTPSEAKIIQYVLLGMSNKEVGHHVGATEKTVKFHLTNVYRKTQVKSRSELMTKFMVEKPLTDLPPGVLGMVNKDTSKLINIDVN